MIDALLLDEAAHVRESPTVGLAFLWTGTVQNAGDQGGFLTLAQDRSAVAFGMIEEPGQSLGVEALDSIAQGLALDSDRSGGIGPTQIFQRVGNGPDP